MSFKDELMPAPPIELMYRPPDEEIHRNLPEVLDDIHHRLNSIETKLEKLLNGTDL